MAQKWRVTPDSRKPPGRRAPKPLDEEKLRDLALHYAGRYATTRAKLVAYLQRKLRERGWEGDRPPDPDALAARFADLGYVDDAGFAAMRGAALTRRGYGVRRVGEVLRAAGVADGDLRPAIDDAAAARWAAAEAFARRKRIGPYAAETVQREQREKRIAAFLRAGHDYDTARRWVDAAPGEMPDRED